MKLTQQVSFRTTDEVKEAIEGLALDLGKKPSQVINELLIEAIEFRKKQRGAFVDIEKIHDMVTRQEQRINQLEMQQLEMAKKSAA
jgi:antitoxin component of RelBE/YafQ-DinJ toxin-antitoxin module